MFKNLQRYNFLANHNYRVLVLAAAVMFKNLQRYNFLANHNFFANLKKSCIFAFENKQVINFKKRVFYGTDRKSKKMLPLCKYYKGEGVPVSGSDPNYKMLAMYERAWVFGAGSPDYVAEYKASGLASFCADDGVPLSLKALLFNRYCVGAWSTASAVVPFKSFYKKYYCI